MRNTNAIETVDGIETAIVLVSVFILILLNLSHPTGGLVHLVGRSPGLRHVGL